eukprot:scaffold928_cov370-Prasinococcus_capsulatus_cf.AAC.20
MESSGARMSRCNMDRSRLPEDSVLDACRRQRNILITNRHQGPKGKVHIARSRRSTAYPGERADTRLVAGHAANLLILRRIPDLHHAQVGAYSEVAAPLCPCD